MRFGIQTYVLRSEGATAADWHVRFYEYFKYHSSPLHSDTAAAFAAINIKCIAGIM